MSKLSQSSREWRHLRIRVFASYGWKCANCGRSGRLELHHVHPLAEGGTNEPYNLMPLCRQCHLAEHDRYGVLGARREWNDYLKEL